MPTPVAAFAMSSLEGRSSSGSRSGGGLSSNQGISLARVPVAGPIPNRAHGVGSVGRTGERNLERDAATALVERCIQGDGLAWRELVEGHSRRVYGLCYRFTGNSGDAEDLTQEVFLKIYKSLGAFDAKKGAFPTWITAMTRNLLVDHFRKTRQDRATDSMDAGWETGEEEIPGMAARIEDGGATPLESAMSRQAGRVVQAALCELSPELREAVILRDLEDMDYKEIAEVLRIPEGTVKSRISRGRAELARLLERTKGQVM